MKKRFSLSRLLDVTGGYYIIIVTAVTQLLSFPGAIVGILLVNWNLELPLESLENIYKIAPFSIALGNLLLLLVAWWMTSSSRKILNEKKAGKTTFAPADELASWQQITSFPWRYSMIMGITAYLLNIMPLVAYMFYSGIANADQTIYSLMGFWISVSTISLLTNLILVRVLVPAQISLTPSNFEIQHKGRSGAPILFKILSAFFTLIIAAIFSLGSIGYHQITKAFDTDISPQQLLYDYQFQSIVISLLVLASGIGFTYFIAHSVSDPARMLIEVSKKIEQGKFSDRALLIASDEVGELTIFFNQMISRLEVLHNFLGQQVAERTAQLSAVNEVGLSVNAILDPDELIEKVVNLITDRFGHYYSALFLVDPTGKWAELRSATGEAGRVLRESHHRLEIGGKSMVGTAIHQKQARIALDVGAEPVRFDNPILPYTHSEIALPLIVGERVLGALDVQSTKQSAFGPQDVETLQNMTNQVSIALENARLFKEVNERLQEVQSVQRQYLSEAWTSQATRENLEYGVGDDTASEHETALDVPLALRDQIIGQIKLTGDVEWSPEERVWVESVATQTAIALENARLMEESREQATLERTVAEITTKIWAASTIDGILQTAVKEIGRTLNLSEATIELQANEEGA